MIGPGTYEVGTAVVICRSVVDAVVVESRTREKPGAVLFHCSNDRQIRGTIIESWRCQFKGSVALKENDCRGLTGHDVGEWGGVAPRGRYGYDCNTTISAGAQCPRGTMG